MGLILCNGLRLAIDYFTGKIGNAVFMLYSLTLREGRAISFAL